jgi:hypothetical protein
MRYPVDVFALLFVALAASGSRECRGRHRRLAALGLIRFEAGAVISGGHMDRFGSGR